ncbi:Sensor protein PfeS [compost metagenome]
MPWLLPTRSLFWRAFLTFWSAMAIILVCGMLFTAAVAWYRINSLDGLNPASLTHDAEQVARIHGEDGLQRWVEAMDQRYSALKIYILDANDTEILGRTLPARMHDWLSAYRAASDRPTQAELLAPETSGQRVSWWQPQLLVLPDGSERLMLFLPFDSSHWEVLGLSPVALALLLFALAVTAPFCWALTRHVTAPLTQLRHTTHALAAGDLDAHTPAKLAGRKDELGLLARDFNAMADRLKAVVDTREQLLHNIAHELRSPLARLRLASELARRKGPLASCQRTGAPQGRTPGPATGPHRTRMRAAGCLGRQHLAVGPPGRPARTARLAGLDRHRQRGGGRRPL